MKNKKGFVLTETLIVVVFLSTIFTFIYVSIIPLLGKYEDMTYRVANIDIVYKLYYVRKMIYNDNKNSILSGTFKKITCEDDNISDKTFCGKLMEYLELNNYILVYADNINNRLDDFKTIQGDPNKEVYDYILKYKKLNGRVLVLLDKNTHAAAHLKVY